MKKWFKKILAFAIGYIAAAVLAVFTSFLIQVPFHDPPYFVAMYHPIEYYFETIFSVVMAGVVIYGALSGKIRVVE